MTAVAATTCWLLLVDLEAQLHALEPRIHRAPRSTRPSWPSTSVDVPGAGGPVAVASERRPGRRCRCAAPRWRRRRSRIGSVRLARLRASLDLLKMLTSAVVLSVGLRGYGVVPKPPVDPCPVSPRTLSGSESARTKSAWTYSWTTSWAIRSPTPTVNASRGSRLTRLTRISPR